MHQMVYYPTNTKLSFISKRQQKRVFWRISWGYIRKRTKINSLETINLANPFHIFYDWHFFGDYNHKKRILHNFCCMWDKTRQSPIRTAKDHRPRQARLDRMWTLISDIRWLFFIDQPRLELMPPNHAIRNIRSRDHYPSFWLHPRIDIFIWRDRG